jgi:hypothetical protein
MAPGAAQLVPRIPIVCRPAPQEDKACLQTDRWKASAGFTEGFGRIRATSGAIVVGRRSTNRGSL